MEDYRREHDALMARLDDVMRPCIARTGLSPEWATWGLTSRIEFLLGYTHRARLAHPASGEDGERREAELIRLARQIVDSYTMREVDARFVFREARGGLDLSDIIGEVDKRTGYFASRREVAAIYRAARAAEGSEPPGRGLPPYVPVDDAQPARLSGGAT